LLARHRRLDSAYVIFKMTICHQYRSQIAWSLYNALIQLQVSSHTGATRLLHRSPLYLLFENYLNFVSDVTSESALNGGTSHSFMTVRRRTPPHTVSDIRRTSPRTTVSSGTLPLNVVVGNSNSIRPSLKPSNIWIRGNGFLIPCDVSRLSHVSRGTGSARTSLPVQRSLHVAQFSVGVNSQCSHRAHYARPPGQFPRAYSPLPGWQ
jgi:hypothetical protein